MDIADQPDPNFCPLLGWGDPIPLHWQCLEPGRWLAWPPKRFRTLASEGPVFWTLRSGTSDYGLYEPDAEVTSVPPGTILDIKFGWESPIVDWGSASPCRWTRHDDGGASVQLGVMRVSLPVGQLLFDLVSRTAWPYFEPTFAHKVVLSDGVVGNAENMTSRGVLGMVPVIKDKVWRRRGPARRWILGHLSVGPTGSRFIDASDLLPLTIPSREQIEAEEMSRLSPEERARGDVLYIRLIEALSQSQDLMDQVGDDAFAEQLQCFMSENELLRIDNGGKVVFTSDRNYGVILASLRRYGEPYTMYNSSWAEPDAVVQAMIKRLFEAAGYLSQSYGAR